MKKMKNIIFKSKKSIALLVLINLFSGVFAFGQQKTFTDKPDNENALFPIASFQSRNAILLNDESPLSEFYTADIKNFNFNSEEEAILFFDSMTDNLLSYKLDFLTKKVTIHLHLKYAAKNWGKTEWTSYLNDKFKAQ